MAQGESATVDDTDKGAAPADFGDEGAFTESHLPNPLAEGGFTCERAYATGAAGRQLAKWQGLRVETIEGGEHEAGSK